MPSFILIITVKVLCVRRTFEDAAAAPTPPPNKALLLPTPPSIDAELELPDDSMVVLTASYIQDVSPLLLLVTILGDPKPSMICCSVEPFLTICWTNPKVNVDSLIGVTSFTKPTWLGLEGAVLQPASAKATIKTINFRVLLLKLNHTQCVSPIFSHQSNNKRLLFGIYTKCTVLILWIIWRHHAALSDTANKAPKTIKHSLQR